MLILSSKLKSTPVLSLQTGSQLATIGEPLIDPVSLKIVAYKLENNTVAPEEMLIRIAEIRELSRIGFIIDSADDFILPTDVIKIKELIDLNFDLKGMKVVDQKSAKLGSIIDFTINLSDFSVQQLIVKRPLLKSFNHPELVIPYNKIVMIDDEKVVVKSETESAEDKSSDQTDDFIPNYINPFR